MRAVRSTGAGGVELVDIPRPEGEGVRVRVRSAGICGSDLHLIDGPMQLPNTLGHEFAGELENGTPVAIEPLASCQSCDCCNEGQYNLCRGGAGMLLGLGHDGGMADEVLVPERAIVPLLPGISIENACLIEPLAVAVHGLRRVGVSSGHRVAVIGGGSIGLCAVAGARAAGAEVALAARHEHQVEAGRQLGAQAVSGEYDIVIDCAGTSSALDEAVKLARPAAALLLLGTYWDGMQMPGIALCMKEINVVPSSMYAKRGLNRDFDVAAGIAAANPEIARQMITHRYSLDEAATAFATARDRSAGAIKVVFDV
jgi:threonine dehydrogenase-like Zn-dependent dehydrogenase